MSLSTEIVQRNFQQLQPIFESLLDTALRVTESRSRLYSLYYQWSNVSQQTVDSLLEIRERVLKLNLNTNIANLTGSSVAVLGSISSIIGVTFAFPTGGLSLALTAGGAVAATVGGGVTIGTKITKGVLSGQLRNEAEGVFSENISLTDSLEDEKNTYVDLLNQFRNELEELHGMDAFEALAHITGIEDIFLRDLEFDGDVVNSLPPSLTEMENMLPEHRSLLKTIREYISRLLTLIQRDKFLSQLWKSMKEAAIKNSKYVIPSGGATISILNAARSLKDAFQRISVASRVAIGVVNGIFVIFGILDIAMTAADIYSGSISKQTEDLLNTAENLRQYREDVVEIMADSFGWHI